MKQRMYYLGQTRKHSFWLDLRAGKAYIIGLVVGYIYGKINERRHTWKIANECRNELVDGFREMLDAYGDTLPKDKGNVPETKE